MPICQSANRPAASLVELVMYFAFLGTIAGVLISVLISTSEARLRQQNIEETEREGAQIIQSMTRRIRNAETITLPAIGASGGILSMLYGTSSADPTLFALSGTTLYAAEHDTLTRLSGTGVTVSNVEYKNTSTSTTQQSVLISFRLSQRPGLVTAKEYVRDFETLITLFPDDNVSGDECGCNLPACTNGVLNWEICSGETCSQATNELDC